MKRVISLLLALVLVFALAACGANKTESSNAESSKTEEPKKEAAPPDLTGEWKQTNSSSEGAGHMATIKDGTIEIYWFDSASDTKALYWAGSYEAPTTADEPYTWDSANDKEKTDFSIMASAEDTKTFTYEKGIISYSASAMGVTQTIKLEKQQ